MSDSKPQFEEPYKWPKGMEAEGSAFDRLSVFEKRDDDKPHAWIQHKGTDICMDVHCSCGAHTHFDGDCCYFLKCGACGKPYIVGQTIVLLELAESEAAGIDRFKVSDSG